MTSVTLLLAFLLRLNPLSPDAAPLVPSPQTSSRNNNASGVPAVERFRALRTDNAVILQWTVTGNEEASLFRLEKSADGSNYRPAALLFSTEDKQTENYSFSDKPARGRVYYRIILETKDRSVIMGKPIGVDDKNPANDTHE